MLDNFNPLRNQPPGEIHKLLYGVATSTNKRICFLNDNTGIYFNSLRKLENVEACFEDSKYYNFYIMLRDDIYLSKTVFTELNKGFNFKLLDHFEERLYSETNPIVTAYIIFLLHNMSDAIDSSLGLYRESNFDRVLDKTKNLDSYFVKGAKFHFKELPHDSFIISLEDNFVDREGLIITTKKMKYDLVKSVGKLNLYYKDK